VIVTLGKKGALLKNHQQELLIETTDLKPVDTTGAGDAFNGGLAVALAEERDIADAVRFANCTASISVTRRGTSPAMPYRHEIDSLYEKFYSSGGQKHENESDDY
jgi:ribokinase